MANNLDKLKMALAGIIVPDSSETIKFYAGPEAGYKKLTVDDKAVYFITDTQKIYRGNKLIASNNISSVTELPPVEDAIPGMMYILTTEDGTSSINIINGDKSAYITLGTSASSEVTPESMVEFKNKTIDANFNEIKNLTVDNFKEGVVVTSISTSDPSTERIVTEASLVSYMGGSFIPISKADYDALEEKDPNAIYIITDTHEIHRGGYDFSQSVYMVDEFTDDLVGDKLYIKKDTLETRFYYTSTEYDVIFTGLSASIDKVSTDHDTDITTIGAIKEYVLSFVDPMDHTIDGKAPILNPVFEGKVTLPTSTPTGDLEAASKGYVDTVADETLTSAKEYADTKTVEQNTMMYKGTVGADGTVTDLPDNPNAGWTYKVSNAGTYAGENCEVGDIIICTVGGSNPRWMIMQKNIVNAVTGTPDVVSGNIPEYDGVSGLKIKDSGKFLKSSVPEDAVFTDTTYSIIAPSDKTNEHVILRLESSTGNTQDVAINGIGATSVTTDSTGNILITSKNTTYTFTGSAVSIGNKEVFVITLTDADGHTEKVSVHTDDKISITSTVDGQLVLGLNQLYGTDISMAGYDKGTDATPVNTSDTVSSAIGKLENAKAPINNPTFTGTVTLPKDPETDLEAATKKYVDVTAESVLDEAVDALSTHRVMIFKGTVGIDGTVTTLPDNALGGWTYKVSSAGTYAGQICEEGDIAICTVGYDETTQQPARWIIIQRNIIQAVTNSDESGVTPGNVPIYDGNTGIVIRDSGLSLKTSVPEDAVFTDTTYNINTPYNAKNGEVILSLIDSNGDIKEIGIKGINATDVSTGPTGDIIINSRINEYTIRTSTSRTTIGTAVTNFSAKNIKLVSMATKTYHDTFDADKMYVSYYRDYCGYGCLHYSYDQVPEDAEIISATLTVPVLDGVVNRKVTLSINEINQDQCLIESQYGQKGVFAAPGVRLDSYTYKYSNPFNHSFDVLSAIKNNEMTDLYFSIGHGLDDESNPATAAIIGEPTLSIIYRQVVEDTRDVLLVSITDKDGNTSTAKVLSGTRISMELTPDDIPIINAAPAVSKDIVLDDYVSGTDASPIVITDTLAQALSKLEYGKAPINNPIFTGSVILESDPIDDMEAATKGYVDDNIKDATTWSDTNEPTDIPVRHTVTTKDELSNVQLIAGQLIYVSDTHEQYMDTNSGSNVVRIKLSSTLFIATEDARAAIVDPVQEIVYFVVETGNMWYYNGDTWILMNNRPRIIDCGDAFG